MNNQSPRGLGAYYLNSFVTLLLANMFHYSLIVISNDVIGSKAFTGILFFSIFVPIIFLMPFVGNTLDKRSRKEVLLFGQIITLLAYILLLLTSWLQISSAVLPFLLMAAALTMGTSLAMIVPARISLLADIVSKENLSNATATSAMFPMLGFSLAPACVDYLSNSMGQGSYFELLIILHLAGMLLIILIPYKSNLVTSNNNDTPLKGYLDKSPLLRETLMFFCLIIFIIGPFQTLLPVLFVEELGVSNVQRGLYMSSLGLGLLSGGIVSRLYITRLNSIGKAIFIISALIGFLVGMIASVNTAPLAATLLYFAGIFLGFGCSALTVLIQNVTDDRYRGRLNALFSLIFQLAPALGGLITGIIAQLSSTRTSLMASAILIFFLSIFFHLVFSYLNNARLNPQVENR